MTPANTAADTPTSAPVRTQSAHIRGTVEYREGDGPMMTIRQGPVGVQITHSDATLSWTDGDTRGAAAMPIGIFRNYLARGTIQIDA